MLVFVRGRQGLKSVNMHVQEGQLLSSPAPGQCARQLGMLAASHGFLLLYQYGDQSLTIQSSGVWEPKSVASACVLF